MILHFFFYLQSRGQCSPRALQEKLFNASKQGNLPKLELLLSEKSINANHIGNGGKSALYHAITQQHVPAVKTLLDHGVDVHLSSFATYHRDHAGTQIYNMCNALFFNCLTLCKTLYGRYNRLMIYPSRNIKISIFEKYYYLIL